jgi:hypothetical protein
LCSLRPSHPFVVQCLEDWPAQSWLGLRDGWGYFARSASPEQKLSFGADTNFLVPSKAKFGSLASCMFFLVKPPDGIQADPGTPCNSSPTHMISPTSIPEVVVGGRAFKSARKWCGGGVYVHSRPYICVCTAGVTHRCPVRQALGSGAGFDSHKRRAASAHSSGYGRSWYCVPLVQTFSSGQGCQVCYSGAFMARPHPLVLSLQFKPSVGFEPQ